MGIWDTIDNFLTEFSDEKARAEAEKRRKEAEAISKRLKDDSLTCRRCGKLAAPLMDTGNRYRCGACGNQFAGARHGWVTANEDGGDENEFHL